VAEWLPPRPPEFPDADAQPPPRAPEPPAPAPPPRAPVRRPPRTVAQPSSPLALGGLSAASVGVILLVLTAGLSYWFSLVLGLVGLVMGRRAQRRIAAGGPGRPGQARAAVIMGLVGIGLAGVAAVVWIILSANGVTPGDLIRALRRAQDHLRTR
jgi:hypothetical protein